MSKKAFLYLMILSTLLCAGCLIKGRLTDQNGTGVAGVTVTPTGHVPINAMTQKS